MFKLKRPCVNCPFRKGQGELFQLPRLRLREIINGTAFQCHKTVDYENGPIDESGFTEPIAGDRPQQCAGLIATLHRSGKPNQIMQVAVRLTGLDLDQFDPGNEAYSSIDEAIAAHCGQD